MKFLLVNANAAVKKIFDITARRAGIELEVVNSIQSIPLTDDYNCVFIDDGVLNTGEITSFKSKMLTTKFYLVLSKNAPIVSGFDGYIRKPFLPTDIYELLKKEKQNEINMDSESYEDVASADNVAGNKVDLSEFSDSEDEFLSGIKDSTEIPMNPQDLGADLNNIDLNNIDLNNAQDSDVSLNDDEEINFTYDEPVIETAPQTSAPQAKSSEPEVVKEAKPPREKNVPIKDDSINFDEIFAMQDEFLESQPKPKYVIGGDGYRKKESKPAQPAQAQNPQPSQNTPARSAPKSENKFSELESLDSEFDDMLIDDSAMNEIKSISKSRDDAQNDENLALDDLEWDTDANMLGFDLNEEKAENKNIHQLSDEELEELDDEALLRLQEESLSSLEAKNEPQSEPKILNKQDINEITNILENSNLAGEPLSIQNDEFSSLTQEALSEVLDEAGTPNLESSDNFDNFNENEAQISAQITNPPPPKAQIDVGETRSNVNVDLSDIIKSFPIDKLRELLSGAQITINITFPTTKK